MDTASSVVGHTHTHTLSFSFCSSVMQEEKTCFHSFLPAWNDGNIRIFAPESGRLMLMIHDAHRMGVTAIAGTRSCKRIVSGGGEGQVSAQLHRPTCSVFSSDEDTQTRAPPS